MKKIASTKRLVLLATLTVGVMLGLLAGFVAPGKQVRAIESCTADKWYNCAIRRSEMEGLINQWCGKAETLSNVNYRDVCKLKLWDWGVNTEPNELAAYGIVIPSWCALGASPTDDQRQQIPAKCWAMLNRRTNSKAWYEAIKRVEEECGGEGAATDCKADIIREFLSSQSPPWANATPPTTNSANTGINTGTKASETPFVQRLVKYIQWISSGIGILAVLVLIISGIQYTASGDNAQSVADAKKRIVNVVIGIFIYLFMFALLQFIIPGGIISQ